MSTKTQAIRHRLKAPKDSPGRPSRRSPHWVTTTPGNISYGAPRGRLSAWVRFVTRSPRQLKRWRHARKPATPAGGRGGNQPVRSNRQGYLAQLREILTVNLSIRGPHKTLRRHAVTRKGVYE